MVAINEQKVNPWRTEEGRALLRECYRSNGVYAKTFFPDRFTLPFSSRIHDVINTVLDDRSITRAVFAAPRGSGKTSGIMSYTAKEITFQMSHYIIMIGCSQETIMEQTENLKRELVENEQLVRMFGAIDTRDDFSKQRWIARNKAVGIDTMVVPRGAGQAIRGRLYKNWRPDLIIVDDLDGEEMSEEQRRKNRYWFRNSVCNLIELGNETARIIVVGSLTSDDCLVAELLEDEEWYGVKLAIGREDRKGQLVSNWPERISDEALRRRYEMEKKRGNLDGFYREMMSEPLASEDATFLVDYFQEYDELEEKLDQRGSVENVVLLDPARLGRTQKMHTSDSAIVGAGVDLEGGGIYVRDVTAGKFYPDELYKETVDMAIRLRTVNVGIEVTGLHVFITEPFLQYCAMRGFRVNLIELPPRGSKEERISALIPFYRQKRVWHNPAVCGKLERQLLRFPVGKEKDVMDAFAYIVPMMEEGKMMCTRFDDSDVGLAEWYKECEAEDKAMGDFGDGWMICPEQAAVSW